jgi:Glycosyl Hydrolase Family 88/Bacterial Ig domain
MNRLEIGLERDGTNQIGRGIIATGIMPKKISIPLPNIPLTTLLIPLLLLGSGVFRADALTAVDDSVATLPNSPLVIAALTNDFILANNPAAILRVTQPAHGRVIINSTPVTTAELTPLFHFAAVQLSNTVAQVANTNLYPWTTLTNGSWSTAPANDNNWISGFFPGALWLIYEHTGDTNYRAWAENWMAGIAPMQFSTNTDDVGFVINTSFGNGYRLTGNPDYKSVMLQAAQSLSNRFNPFVGCLADDRLLDTATNPPPFEVIMDTMMNSELLYGAYDLGGSTNLYNMALSHAGRTLTNQVRADGSTYHLVIYNDTNGAVLYRGNRAIDPPLDTWARGQAWAIHGFTTAFQETGDTRFLDTAKRAADFYINHVPSDYVPYWYFQSNGIPPIPPLRDSSAAAITLSALLELSQLATNSSDGAKYWLAARHIFNSLSSTNYLAQGTASSGILLHGNSVDAQTDASLIYGDYYFIEALKRFNDFYSHTTLTYIPDPNFSGNDTFTYQVCDSSGASSTATVTVTVGVIAQISLSPVTHWPVISFPTSGGGNYFVQYLDSLLPDASWDVLATNISGSGAVVSITDTNPPARRFYRVGME